MIQILSINHAIEGGNRIINSVECKISASDSPLHAFNQVIKIKPDIIVINMDPALMDVDMLVGRLKKMQAAEGIPLLLLAEYEEDVEKYLKDDRTFMLPDDEEDVTILEWIIKKLGAKPKSQCSKILVVDDDPMILGIAELYLGGRYDVITASSAKVAFDILSTDVPDLILLDIAMPQMDGKETIKKFKKDERLAKVPVLFQTGMAGVNTVKECMALGASGFVVKPVQKAQLLEKVNDALGVVRSKKSTLLLIDEFDFHLSLVTNMLQDSHNVIKAPATLYAINVIEERRPKAVLLNADNSLYLLNKLREKSNSYKIPIVLMSHSEPTDVAQNELRKPNTYFIRTPLNKDELQAVLEETRVWREAF